MAADARRTGPRVGRLRLAVPVLLIVSVIAVGALAPLLVSFAVRAGHQLEGVDVGTDYVLGAVWSLLLAASILLWPIRARHKSWLLVVWGAKVVTTLVVMLPYESFFLLDTFYYFDLGGDNPSTWPPLGRGGTAATVWVAWIQRNLLVDSFHAAKLTFSMIGLLGTYLFYRAISCMVQRDDPKLFFGMALFPSVLFWSSILGKDPLAFFAIGLHVYGFVRLFETRRARYIVPFALGLLLAVAVRPWLGIILVAPLVFLAAVKIRGGIARAAVLSVGLAVGGVLLFVFLRGFDIASIPDLVTAASGIAEGFSEGDPVTFDSPLELLLFSPLGAFSALFRPLPGEVMSAFGLVAGLENLVLLGLTAVALVRVRRSDLSRALVLWSVALIVVWAFAYGVVSFHNVGAAVRFKLQVLPLLVGLAVHFARRPSARQADDDPSTRFNTAPITLPPARRSAF